MAFWIVFGARICDVARVIAFVSCSERECQIPNSREQTCSRRSSNCAVWPNDSAAFRDQVWSRLLGWLGHRRGCGTEVRDEPLERARADIDALDEHMAPDLFAR